MPGQSCLQINGTYRRSSVFWFSYKNKIKQLKQLEQDTTGEIRSNMYEKILLKVLFVK